MQRSFAVLADPVEDLLVGFLPNLRRFALALCRSREPFYRQADLTVGTTGLGPDQVVSRILGALAAREQAAR